MNSGGVESFYRVEGEGLEFFGHVWRGDCKFLPGYKPNFQNPVPTVLNGNSLYSKVENINNILKLVRWSK